MKLKKIIASLTATALAVTTLAFTPMASAPTASAEILQDVVVADNVTVQSWSGTYVSLTRYGELTDDATVTIELVEDLTSVDNWTTEIFKLLSRDWQTTLVYETLEAYGTAPAGTKYTYSIADDLNNNTYIVLQSGGNAKGVFKVVCVK